MRYQCFQATAILLGVFMAGTSYAAARSSGTKIYTHCTDNSGELAGQCMVYPTDSSFYSMCMGNANLDAVYTCQRYRVPLSYQGTFFENLSLSQYPTVGAPTQPRPGTAPLDLKGSLLGTLLHLY